MSLGLHTNTCSHVRRTERLQSRSRFSGDWSNGDDAGLQNPRLGFDSLVPRLIQAVIFDLDGLLLDSESAWDGGRKALAAEHGLEWPEGATEAMLGMSSPEWSRYVHEELRVPLPRGAGGRGRGAPAPPARGPARCRLRPFALDLLILSLSPLNVTFVCY